MTERSAGNRDWVPIFDRQLSNAPDEAWKIVNQLVERGLIPKVDQFAAQIRGQIAGYDFYREFKDSSVKNSLGSLFEKAVTDAATNPNP